MEWLSLLISIVALGMSFLALKKTGGMAEMKKEGEAVRKKTADLLDRLEKKVRGEEKGQEKESLKWGDSKTQEGER
jgi:hypothetical protein